MKKNTKIRKWLLTFILLIIASMMVFPIVFTLSNSFMTEKEISHSYLSENEIQQDNNAQREFHTFKVDS